jgi:hypothetical protein
MDLKDVDRIDCGEDTLGRFVRPLRLFPIQYQNQTAEDAED